MSRHLAKHIPGNPRIIVQNMGGAAGLIGTKYLGEVAPRDGSMVGYFTGSTQRFVSNPERFNVDFRTYEFIAVLPSGRIHFMRTDVKPGMRTAADVIKGENIVVGGLGRDGPKDLAMRLTLDMLGANVQIRHRLQFERAGDARAPARRDQLLRRLAPALQIQDRTAGEGGRARCRCSTMRNSTARTSASRPT